MAKPVPGKGSQSGEEELSDRPVYQSRTSEGEFSQNLDRNQKQEYPGLEELNQNPLS